FRSKLRFDLGDLGGQRFAPPLRDRLGDVGIGLQRPLHGGEGRAVDLLAKRALAGIALLEGASDRFLYRVQASGPPQGVMPAPWLSPWARSINRERTITRDGARPDVMLPRSGDLLEDDVYANVNFCWR